MIQIVPLTSNKHLKTNVKESTDYSRFSTEHIVPVVIREIITLSSEYPIVFIKNAKTEEFMPVAMMGLKNGINLYCQTPQWDAPLKPLGFNNAPLSLMKANENSDDVMICIDEDSNLVSETEGNPLFTLSGEQSEYLKQRANALLDMAAMTQQTSAISKYLEEKNLLSPQQLTVKLASEENNINIGGIYMVNDETVNNMSNELLIELKEKGLLPVIYAHRASLHQVPRLIAKQNQYDADNK
ncbi:SapC family protein [Shewanella sp. Scap07]|uniref:SapC family protein n=1 Tax=Shewanella sp. Scap07 TaxID=2589987 RepID=UPI0015BCAC78|nr:SapC family protein [Shewanella sp. Scap07]QLE84660.1 SapC family protein [Shewanella sp. Scap07]